MDQRKQQWWIPAVVEGQSMEPVLWPGTVVLLEPAMLGGIPETGDIAAFQTKTGMIIHRVLGRHENGWIARGDRSGSADPVFPDFSLVGTLRMALDSKARACAPRAWVRAAHSSWGLRLRWIPGRMLGPLSWKLYWKSLGLGSRGNTMNAKRFRTQQVGADVAIYDSDSGDVHVLNPSALMIWNLLKNGGECEEAVKALTGFYPDYPVDSIRRDVVEVTKQLVALGLLAATEEDTGRA